MELESWQVEQDKNSNIPAAGVGHGRRGRQNYIKLKHNVSGR
jgi:hypothetical protein